MSRTAGIGLAIGGVAWFVVQAWLVRDHFWIPGGDAGVFLQAGSDVRAGVSPYNFGSVPQPQWFLYGPPWVVVFAALSLLPVPVAYCMIVAAEFAALRYMAGSWLHFGWLLWWPLMPFELLGGTINLIVAAAIVAAVRGHPWLALMGSFAKISPMLAADPRAWRRYVLPFVVIVAITLPWPWLWAGWFHTLTGALSIPAFGPQVPVPLIVRAPIALALILYGRPWSRALGACVAIPALYWLSLVVFVAPLAVALTTPVNHPGESPITRRNFTRVRRVYTNESTA